MHHFLLVIFFNEIPNLSHWQNNDSLFIRNLCTIEYIFNLNIHFNFQIGNHDNRRIADRIGAEYANALNMMLLTLPGTPTSYYGEELGMRGGDYAGFPPKDPFAITSNNPVCKTSYFYRFISLKEKNVLFFNLSRNNPF